MHKILILCAAFFLLQCQSNHAQSLIDAEFIEHLTPTQVSAQYGVPLFFINNGVNLYKVTYNTPDIDGNMSVASGLVVIPDAPAIYPLLCYQHGTVGSREEVPSNVAGDPIGVIYASVGFVTSSADFLGLGDSPGTHPYVHADTEASAAIDLLFATRELIGQEDQAVELNDQLFVAGYSQGGHAGAAAHREIQQNFADEFTVTAAAHMSGPYSISGVMRDLILSDEEYFSTAYIPNTLLSYNAVYDLYDSVEDMFKPEYAEKIEMFAAEEITLWELEVELQTLLFMNEGGSFPRRMLQDTLVAAIESDPNHPANLALADNDVFDWAPDCPTRLYYCTADDQVPFENSPLAEAAMTANGAPDVEAIDVETNASHTECVAPAITQSIFFFTSFQEIEELPTSNENLRITLPGVTVAPNPASDFFTVLWENEQAETAQGTLFDTAMRPVRTFQITANTEKRISLTDVPAGMYYVVISTEKGRSTDVLMKE